MSERETLYESSTRGHPRPAKLETCGEAPEALPLTRAQEKHKGGVRALANAQSLSHLAFAKRKGLGGLFPPDQGRVQSCQPIQPVSADGSQNRQSLQPVESSLLSPTNLDELALLDIEDRPDTAPAPSSNCL